MAYGVKYRLKADSVKWKDEIILDILEDGYGGAVLPRAIGAGGIVLSKESAGKVCGTNLKFTIQADTDFEYITFADMATRQYMVNLYRGGSLIWVGYLIADEYSEALINTPYDVQLTATDGLGLLKTVDYIPETDFSSLVHRVDVIDKILSTINLGLPYRIAYGVTITGGTDNIFYKAYFHDDYFAGWNCYDVLEAILPPDSTITQHNAQWMVRRGEQDSEATHMIYTPTVPLGNYTVTTGAGETVLSLAPIGTGDVYPIGSATVGMEYAWKSMDFYSELVKRPSFLKNYDFADGMSSWTASTTGFAETYNNGAGSYLRMVGEHDENAEDVPDEYVYQSFPYEATTGVDFVFSLKYSITGYAAIIGYGYKLTDFVIKGRVKYTDGTTTYYLDETDGWSTTNKNFEIKAQGNRTRGSISWKDFTIYTKTPPLASGTMTVYLYAGITEPYKTLIDVNFTEVVARSMAAEEYEDRQYYPVTMRTNGVEEAEVTIMPTDVPDIDNFERTFYNPQFTAAGARITSYTSGAATGTYTNLMINSLYWLHATNRQKLMGSWRGEGLHLNSVITSDVTGGRKYTVQAGSWDLLNDRIDADLLEIPGSATGSTWAIPTETYDSSAEWKSGGTRPGSSTTGNGGIISYPNYSGLFLPQATWDTYFEIVNPGTSGEYIRALRDFASTGEITAYNANSPTGSFWDNMPVATTGTLGGVIIGSGLNINGSGVISVVGGSGVTDHGALTGLADDDHPQYLNNFRGDARYQSIDSALTEIAALYAGDGSGTPVRGGGVWALEEYVPVSDLLGYLNTRQPKDGDLTAIAALTGTTGLLKKTAENTWTLDTNAYLTGITKTMVESVLTGAITSHTHAYEGSITKSTGYLRWTGSAWEFKNEAYSLSAHNHAGTYEPAFSKNTAFNKNFGTTAGTVTEGNDSRLSDARTPLSHTHGNLTNDGKIGVVSGKPIITSAAGVLTTGSFGSAAGTFAQGNDSRFHTHSNESNLNEINQDLGTGDDVHFLSADVTSLEVDAIVDGVLQTGFGTNLLKYSNLFKNAVWTKYNCTAYDNDAENPFGGDTIKAAFLLWDSSAPVCHQTITHSGTGNYTFSVWLRADTEHTAYIRVISSAQAPAGTAILIKNTWQRFSVTYNFTSAHTTKSVRIELGNEDIFIFGAQLEAGTAPTRYINTGSAGVSETGVHAYGDLRVNGSIVAADEVTAFSDARLKHDIRETTPALQRLMEVNVVDYVMNGDKTGKLRTGVIAQQILPLFPQMVEGSEADYLSVNYEKLVSITIKAIQELNEKVKRLENILAENGISE